MIHLRDYQAILVKAIDDQWSTGAENVAAVLPTGGGKTVVFSHILNRLNQPACAIAHRKELVNQMALSLARMGVPHRIIGPEDLVRVCVSNQLEELGASLYHPHAHCAVAGIDTLIKRRDSLASWLPQVKLWIIDEGHHLVRGNKWHRGVEMFPNAKGLAVTATPVRADGKGLGRHADGVIDSLVLGPEMRELIDMGWLSDYRIFAPLSDLVDRLEEDGARLSKDGDYTLPSMKKASKRSRIVGDVVESYKKIADGKLGITFVTDLETGGDLVTEYRLAGVPAELISADTPTRVRNEIINRLKRRELLQLVNVDIFGEGFDLPAIEVVSMARPTMSYGLYCQQFGRGLRVMEGKDKAIIIDHVGNVIKHGLPDVPRHWSLDGRDKIPRPKNVDDEIPLRYCPECTQPFEKIKVQCPFCGHVIEPEGRATPEQVDGDLHELDPAVLEQMRAEVKLINEPSITIEKMQRAGAPAKVIAAYRSRAIDRCEAQDVLRLSIDWWAAFQQQRNRTVRETNKLFYLTFGVDVLSSQKLGKKECYKLADRVNNYIGRMAS